MFTDILFGLDLAGSLKKMNGSEIKGFAHVGNTVM